MVMRLTVKADLLDFNARGFIRDTHKAVKEAMAEAARKFIAAAVSDSPDDGNPIPVDSGMAKGIFSALGEAFGVDVPIDPVHTNLWYYDGGLKLPKTPESGADLTTNPQDLIRREGNKYIFNFKTKVIHYRIEDFFGSRSPTAPWGSFERARAAFLAEIKLIKINNHLPKLDKYLVKDEIYISGGGELIRQRKQKTVR